MLYDKKLLDLQKRIAAVTEIQQNCLKSIQPIKEIANRYQNALEPLSKMQRPYREIIEPLNQFSRTYSDSLSSLNKTIASVTLAKNMYLERCNKLNDVFSANFVETLMSLSDISLKTLNESYGSSNEVSFTDNEVIISDETLTNISSAIEIPSECANHRDINGKSTHLPFKDFFLYILYPLILAIMPMLQSNYLDSRNALESQKETLKIEEYQERALQIDEKALEINEQILTSLNKILDSLNDLQESQQSDHKKEDALPLHHFDAHTPQEAAYVNDDVPDSSNESDNID